MATATRSPPQPPPLPPHSKYDVFLSFRGDDLRGKIVDHLYSKLQSLKVNTFMDDKTLKKGELIKNITKAIESSKIYVVLFSSGYADSDWCLNELAKISNCVKKKGAIHLAIPVFFHVSPDDVAGQSGVFEEAFKRHGSVFPSRKVNGWKKALAALATTTGWPFDGQQSEVKLVEDISNDVIQRLNDISVETKSTVKVKPLPVEEYNLVSYQELETTAVIRICAMSGLESIKSAKLVYDNIPAISNGSILSCSLKNPRFKPKPNLDPVEPSMKWVKNTWDDDGEVINTIRTCRKKVLVVVDNMHKLENLLQVAAGFGWFGSGSRIVVSTVDVSRKVLKVIHGRWQAPAGANDDSKVDVACFMNEMMDDRDLMRRLRDSLASGGLVDESVWRIRVEKYDGVGMVENGKLEINTELPLFTEIRKQVMKGLFEKKWTVLKGFLMMLVASMIAYRVRSSKRRITSFIYDFAAKYFTNKESSRPGSTGRVHSKKVQIRKKIRMQNRLE
ncbi:Disease resistance-like protein DSC1 [Linum grandiflorum]